MESEISYTNAFTQGAADTAYQAIGIVEEESKVMLQPTKSPCQNSTTCIENYEKIILHIRSHQLAFWNSGKFTAGTFLAYYRNKLGNIFQSPKSNWPEILEYSPSILEKSLNSYLMNFTYRVTHNLPKQRKISYQ